MCISVDYCCVDDGIHGNARGYSRGDYGRLGNRSQEISYYFFCNDVESVDGDERSGYKY